MSALELLLPKAYRLTVIVSPPSEPSLTRRAQAERAVQSVLSQEDPLGTEVIYVHDGSRDGTDVHLQSVFGDAIAQGKLRVHGFKRTLDAGRLRNEGAALAQGNFLAFVKTGDSWKPGRLRWLEPLLSRHDLIIATNQPIHERADWIAALLSENFAITSSAVIRRSLFEEVGGFPERTPGMEDYEFWLRCLVKLSQSHHRDRFVLVQNQHVDSEPDPLRMPGAPGGKILEKLDLLREAFSLLHVAPRIPPQYWVSIAKRIGGTGKAIFKGK